MINSHLHSSPFINYYIALKKRLQRGTSMSRENISTEFNCQRVMVHCSADKLAWFTRLFKLLVCGPSLIPPKWVESGKSFPIKHDVNDKLMSVNPPSGVVTHSYMPFIPLSVLNKYLSVHIFQNSCSKEYHWTHVT